VILNYSLGWRKRTAWRPIDGLVGALHDPGTAG
jgi:hypothetical protein